jgi:hypothetical protein
MAAVDIPATQRPPFRADEFLVFPDDWEMKFGTDGDISLYWDSANSRLEISGDVNITGSLNQTADVAWADDQDAEFGTGTDALLRWSTGDASNHAFVAAMGATNAAMHICNAGDVATDWGLAAEADPQVFIHSNTTPITDYLMIGNHDGTNAFINMVGGTGLQIQIDSVSVLEIDDAAASHTAATDTAGQDVFIEAQTAGGTATAAREGGDIRFTTGAGSDGAAAVAAGKGGDHFYVTGAGGAASGTAEAGASGNITFGTGAAGAHTGGGASGAGGASGSVAITSATGGATSNVGSDNAGNAGNITITGGAGGAASAGTGDGGAGADVVITCGAGGATTGGVAGAPGYIGLLGGIIRGAAYQTIAMGDAAVTLTLVPGTPTGTLVTSNYLAVDAESSGTENLIFPPEADCNGATFFIYNTGGESIVVQSDTPATIITIPTGDSGIISCNGTAWVGQVVTA